MSKHLSKHMSREHTHTHSGTYTDIFIAHGQYKLGDNSFQWIILALSLSPWAWEIVRPREIIVAFNANGSPAHSLFSPGNRVLQSVRGPTSYCSARTNLRLQGKGQRAHCTFSSSVLFPFVPPLLLVSIWHRQTGTTPRTWDCITAVGQSDGQRRGVLCRCGQNDRRSGLSCVTAVLTTDRHEWWRKAAPVLRPSWDRRGNLRGKRGGGWGEGMRQAEARRFTDLQITHGKKQIGLICEHAPTCALRASLLYRLSQSIQIFHTPKRQTAIRQNSKTALKSFPHFPRLDLGRVMSCSLIRL